MKKFLIIMIIILSIPILVLSMIVFSRYNDDNRKKDNSLERELLEIRNIKQKELNAIKELNKEAIDKYEKVKLWNEEITSYFE